MLSYSSLSSALATERELAAREKARSAWERRQRGELRIRPATDADAAALVRLARLDSKGRPPAGEILVAEDAGEVVAAMAVADEASIADPFRATAPVVALLRLRVRQMRAPEPRAPRGTRLSLRRLRARAAGI